MASQGTATSRLAQIQMRFQQKQLQEREQRKMEMTASKVKVPENIDDESTTIITTKSNTTKNLNSSIGNGKVRQMFNERRRGAGIDRSNPLKPITSRTSSSSSTITMASVSTKNADKTFVRKQETTTLRQINGRTMNKVSTNKVTIQKNNNGDDTVDYSNKTYFANNDDLDSETFPEQHLDNFEITLPSKLEALALNNPDSQNEDTNNNSMRETSSRPIGGIKLNPVLTKKSPPVVAAKMTAKPSRPKLSSAAPTVQTNSPLSTTQKPTPSKPKIAVKSSPKMAKPLANSNLVSKSLQRENLPSTPPPGTVACRICNRFFNEDRIHKHEEVCEKMAMKQRKIFDASKHRVKGTEAEKFLKKPPRGSKRNSTITTSAHSTDTSKKSNWRKKHEEFIAAIRAAKEVQAHLAKGGKLSDLPPPPPSENPDYITCPHCSRRFNEAAANRHIPKCATMLHNKPKPPAKRR